MNIRTAKPIFLSLLALSIYGAFAAPLAYGAEASLPVQPDVMKILEASTAIVLKYLLIAIIFESIYSAIFESKFFTDGKGFKVPVKVLLAFLAVAAFPFLDIMPQIQAQIFQASEPPVQHFIGKVITAFLISGGSSGIYKTLAKMNIRNVTAQMNLPVTNDQPASAQQTPAANQ